MSVYYLKGQSNYGDSAGLTGYYYPLYTDASLINGKYHTHTFVGLDDVVFYMPSSEMNHGTENAPFTVDTYLGAGVEYANIPTFLSPTSARSVNANMPKQIASRIMKHPSIQNHKHDDLRVLLLGWAYKPGISDTRETPSKKLAQQLSLMGCNISTWDPYIPTDQRKNEFTDWGNKPYDAKPDVVVLCTAHPEILEIDWEKLFSVSRIGLFFD